MNSQDLRSLLADRAESVDTGRPDRVAEVHGRIRTARRRSAATVAGAAATVAALGFAAVTLPDNTTKTQEPVDQPTDGISTLQPETLREIQDRLASDNPEGLLDPGTYAVEVDDLRPLPVVDLPQGYSFVSGTPELAAFIRFARRDCTISALACRRTRYEPSGPGGRLEVGFWNGEKIMVRPDRLCGGGLDEFKHPGPSVENLATALADLPGFRATAPAPVSLGGYDGLYVELVIVAPRCPLFWITGPNSEGSVHGQRCRPRARRAAVDPRRRRRTDRGRGHQPAGRHRGADRGAHPHRRVGQVHRRRIVPHGCSRTSTLTAARRCADRADVPDSRELALRAVPGSVATTQPVGGQSPGSGAGRRSFDGDLILRANEGRGRHDDALFVHSDLALPRVLHDPTPALSTYPTLRLTAAEAWLPTM